MTLSIIILAYRNAALLRLCLRSIATAMAHSTLEYEIIVVDNASSPETANVVRHDFADQFHHIRLIPLSQNRGYTFGVNEGMRAAQGEFIFSLNHDIVAEAGVAEQLVDYLREHPDVGLIGPRLLYFDDSQQDSCFHFYTPLIIVARRLHLPFTHRLLDRFLMHDTPFNGPTHVDWISGAAYMIRRTVLERVGLLDESLFHYFSDVDWAHQFWQNGLTVVYYPMVALYHYLGRSSKGRFGVFDTFFNSATRWHIQDALRYFRKHGISGRRPRPADSIQPKLIHA
jgi:N-acetylglucosaminyl-diphospho-decaprenol L-rhamnosyltransferase